MKNVLLLVHDDAGQEARLQAALDLTRALSGHLHCLDVTPLPLLSDPTWGGTPTTILYDETQREEANAARVQTRLTGEDVAWNWDAQRGDFASCLTGAMHTADLVVLNRALTGFTNLDMRKIVGDVLMQGEALIVAVSEDCRAFPVGAPALIAWDGSETAMRAVQRGVPLLALAGSVTIFQAGALPGEAIPPAEAASYLARHGIKPEIEIGPGSDGPAAQISHVAGRIGAAYCVMGAFGHSRLREALFGGVTRELLGSNGVPLILAH